MFKVNNKDTRTTPSVSIVSIVNFEHVNRDWVRSRSSPVLRFGYILRFGVYLEVWF